MIPGTASGNGTTGRREDGRPTVVIVGLGPAGRSFLTHQAEEILARADVVLVRTAEHLAAKELVARGARALDVHYEQSDDFEEVYERIVEDVVAAAIANGRVVYAVPGSPFVLETTVEKLRSDDRVTVDIVAGMSFLDLCWQRLGLDPVKQHVRLVDATEFAWTAADDHGPLLVAQVYSRSIASQVKLATDIGPRHPVVVLRHLGHDDESVHEVGWEDIDRSVELDHLCCVYVPELVERIGEELMHAVEIVAILRKQCPWDKEQTHESLARHFIEETYEVIEAIDELSAASTPENVEHFEEELGDVLCQVLFHATLASEEGLFSLADVARTLTEKLVRRHPHVFADTAGLDSADAVVSRWEQIKQKEKGRASLMDGIPNALPALSYATKIERKAKGVGLGFDPDGSATKALMAKALTADALDEELIGELLLAIARNAAARGIDPEASLRIATRALKDRFVAAELAAQGTGVSFSDLSQAARRTLFERA